MEQFTYNEDIDGLMDEPHRSNYIAWRNAQLIARSLPDSKEKDIAWERTHMLHREYLRIRYPRPTDLTNINKLV